MAVFSQKYHKHDGIEERRINLSDIYMDTVISIDLAHIYTSGSFSIDALDITLNANTEIVDEGVAKANLDILSLTNTVNAADMDGTETSILWNQWYFDAGAPAIADAGRVTVGIETDWTAAAATHDAYMCFETALDGTVTEYLRLTSGGKIGHNTTTPGENIAGSTGDPAGLCFHQYNNVAGFQSGRVNLIQEGVGGVWNFQVDLNAGVNMKTIGIILDSELLTVNAYMDDLTTRAANLWVMDYTEYMIAQGTGTPGQNIAGGGSNLSGTVYHIKSTADNASFVVEGNFGGHLYLVDLAGAADDKVWDMEADAGVMTLRARHDDLTIHQDNIMVWDHDGHVSLGSSTINLAHVYIYSATVGNNVQLILDTAAGVGFDANGCAVGVIGGTDITGQDSGIFFKNEQSNNKVVMGLDSSDSDKFHIACPNFNGTNRFTLLQTGLVGINQTSPARRLEVLDASNPQLRLTHTNASVYTEMQTEADSDFTINLVAAGNPTCYVKNSGAGVANLDVDGAATIAGDITSSINGTNSTSFTLDEDNAGAGVDQYVAFNRGSTANDALIYWDENNDKFLLYAVSGGALSRLDVLSVNGYTIAHDTHTQSHTHANAADGNRLIPAELELPLAASGVPGEGDIYFEDDAVTPKLWVYSAAQTAWVYVNLT